MPWRPGQPVPALPQAAATPAHPTPPLAVATLRFRIQVHKGKDETVLECKMHYSAPARLPHTSLQGNSSSSRIRDESVGSRGWGARSHWLGAIPVSFPSSSLSPWLFVSLLGPIFPQPSLSAGLCSWLSLTRLSPHRPPTVSLVSGSFSLLIPFSQTLFF